MSRISPVADHGLSAARSSPSRGLTREEFRVIGASCVGTVFEWYDFILFGAIAPIVGRQFFANADPTTGLIFALLTFSAAFIVRPFGAVVFGRIGDLIGRKYTFLVTILIMGLSTFVVGLLPTYASIGIAAPCLLIAVRLLQGLAIGGEYGGAAVFVAEHSPAGRRGLYTAWIQTTGTLGFVISLFAILVTRTSLGEAAFAEWGWRIPFLVSIVLLAISVWMRLAMHESPVFLRMKAEGGISKAPMREAFGRWDNLKLVLIAFVLSAGFGVIWYTTQFYVLVFLTQTLKVDGWTANLVVMLALLLATPFFVLFGWLSDTLGRKKVILTGILLAALALFPAFKALTHYGNPALEAALEASPVTVTADPADCQFQFNLTGTSKFTSSCDIAKASLVALGVNYANEAAAPGTIASIRVGGQVIPSLEAGRLAKPEADRQTAAFSGAVAKAVQGAGYPAKADPARTNVVALVAITFGLVVLLAVAYGPVPALLVELFPTRIRYSSLSLPITSAPAGSVAWSRPSRSRWWPTRATSISGSGSRSRSPSWRWRSVLSRYPKPRTPTSRPEPDQEDARMSDKPIAVHPEQVDTIVSSWVTAKTLCDPLVTGGAISAVALYFKPGQGHARHNHPETEQLIYVVSGEGEMMIEHEEGRPATQKITAGMLVNIPKGKYHSTFNTGWEPIRILAVYSPPGPEATMRNSPDFTVLPPGAALL